MVTLSSPLGFDQWFGASVLFCCTTHLLHYATCLLGTGMISAKCRPGSETGRFDMSTKATLVANRPASLAGQATHILLVHLQMSSPNWSPMTSSCHHCASFTRVWGIRCLSVAETWKMKHVAYSPHLISPIALLLPVHVLQFLFPFKSTVRVYNRRPSLLASCKGEPSNRVTGNVGHMVALFFLSLWFSLLVFFCTCSKAYIISTGVSGLGNS